MDHDLEDLTHLEMSGMTLFLGMLITVNTAKEPLINSTSRFSSVVMMCPEKFQIEGANDG